MLLPAPPTPPRAIPAANDLPHAECTLAGLQAQALFQQGRQEQEAGDGHQEQGQKRQGQASAAATSACIALLPTCRRLQGCGDAAVARHAWLISATNPFVTLCSRKPKGKDGPKRPTGAYLLFLKDFRRGFLQARRAGCREGWVGRQHSVPGWPGAVQDLPMACIAAPIGALLAAGVQV